MSANLVALCGLLYLYVCVEQAIKGQLWISCVYLGYAIANIGAWKIAKMGLA